MSGFPLFLAGALVCLPSARAADEQAADPAILRHIALFVFLAAQAEQRRLIGLQQARHRRIRA